MSNTNETTIVYRAILDGTADVINGINKVNADLGTSAQLSKEAFAAGKIGRDEMLGDLRSIDAELQKNSQAAIALGAVTEDGVTRNRSFASSIGTSRVAVADLTRELGSATGMGNEFTRTINAALSGMNPLTIALTAGAAAFGAEAAIIAEYNKRLDEAGKLEVEYAKIRAQFPTSSAWRIEDTAAIADESKELDKLGKQLAALKDQQKDGGLGGAETARVNAQIEAIVSRMNTLSEKITEIKGKAIYDSAKANELVTFKDDAQAVASGVDDIGDAIDRLRGKEADLAFARLATLGKKKDSGAVRDEGGLTDDGAAGAAGASFTELYVTASEGRTKIATGEHNKQVALWEAEAKKQAEFNTLLTEASSVASAKVQANFQLIANSAGDAALKTQELHAYINSLPKDVKAKIDLAIQFGGNMALANQLGMGQAPMASRDWTKELEATFAQQSGAIQEADVKAAGGNKDAAIQKWQEQHKLELLGAMQADPGQFTNVQGPLGDIQKGLMAGLEKVKPGDALMKGINNDKPGIVKAGESAGGSLLAGINNALGSDDNGIAALIARALVPSLGKYFLPVGYAGTAQ